MLGRSLPFVNGGATIKEKKKLPRRVPTWGHPMLLVLGPLTISLFCRAPPALSEVGQARSQPCSVATEANKMMSGRGLGSALQVRVAVGLGDPLKSGPRWFPVAPGGSRVDRRAGLPFAA